MDNFKKVTQSVCQANHGIMMLCTTADTWATARSWPPGGMGLTAAALGGGQSMKAKKMVIQPAWIAKRI